MYQNGELVFGSLFYCQGSKRGMSLFFPSFFMAHLMLIPFTVITFAAIVAPLVERLQFLLPL